MRASGTASATALDQMRSRRQVRWRCWRVVQQQGNACLATMGCKISAVESKRIKAGAAQHIVGPCPDDRPYFVNWDATHHEHIGVRVLDSRLTGVKVIAVNHADVSGRVTLHIGGEAAGCQIQKQPPINFDTLKTHHDTFFCTGTNLLFLGNDGDYPGSSGYDFDNSCSTVWPQGQTFDADLNVLVTNWCDKPEALNVTIGCMPGN